MLHVEHLFRVDSGELRSHAARTGWSFPVPIPVLRSERVLVRVLTEGGLECAGVSIISSSEKEDAVRVIDGTDEEIDLIESGEPGGLELDDRDWGSEFRSGRGVRSAVHVGKGLEISESVLCLVE